MLGRIVVLLVIGLAVAIAPSAAADGGSADGGGGDCVWTSSSGAKTPNAGVNARECVGSGTPPG